MNNLASCLILFVLVFASADALADNWGCYDPRPGHPTSAEKIQFVDTVSALAIDAERKHGVPAAAIAAMAIVESGYGWTRTALYARNLFGWKYYSAASAGGRKSYTLTCQPPEDRNNHYIVFDNIADAVDFVAGKLATLPAYRQDGEKYRRARSAGTDVKESVRTWLAGIAAPYNWNPQKYVTDVTRIMNNPLAPSDTISSEHTLYSLSVGNMLAPTGEIHDAAERSNAGVLEATRAFFSSRLITRQCEAPANNYPRWEGFPVRRCVYVDSGVKVQTYMLNATADQLATWTITACEDARAADIKECARVVSRTIWAASSGVFPVAGFIPEPASSGGGTGSATKCFLFRDGVTITTKTIKDAPSAVSSSCPEPDNNGPIVQAKKFARIASTTRAEYTSAGGKEPVGTDNDADPRWAGVIRKLYQNAWGSDRNVLISAKAQALRKANTFH
ncbi:hypothetical protein BTH42_34035 [Burkholderia sp. SRS-W-2-2016]|uniref:glucosaminidase domain-containing protein n=1 Tax=Burkholderia sp. SRS-W-2-2016 TaxID=1926878 RepID=UPI00094AFE6E|nr:glucosaminidase domain-containing protein [Burkholderia sp. SRS-W-2-2016]OLL27186.1 hypothetical protein BTH42_34035 [Burkholderia sp. SRS-W-2-2016]